jgi:hypothetical protein
MSYPGSWLSGGSGTGISNIVEDLTPQLGGDLDLNGKNIDFPTTANISDCLDEDNMASDSATALATQQSIKAYADTKAPIADPTFTGEIGIGAVNVSETELGILEGATVTTAELNYLDDVPDDLTKLAPQYQTIYIDAGAMVPCTTNPAEAGTNEYATYDVDFDYMAFDSGATNERVQFKMTMPENWDRGTVLAKIYWGSAAGASADDYCKWGIKAVSFSNDAALDGFDFGTGVEVEDQVTADGDLMIAQTTAITVAQTAALGDMIAFEMYRASDDETATALAEDAWLFGVAIQFKVTNTVAVWS